MKHNYFFLIGLFLAAAAIGAVWQWYLTAWPSTAPEDLASAFGLLPGLAGSFQPEPVENAVFLFSLVTGGLVLARAAWLCEATPANYWRVKERFHVSSTLVMFAILLGGVMSLDFAGWNGASSMLLVALRGIGPMIITVSLVILVFICLAWMLRRDDAGARWPAIVLIIGFAALAAWLATQVVVQNSDDGILNATHYELFSYSVGQDYLGVPLLLKQPTQYGLYALFLDPLWQIAPPEPVMLTTVMALLLWLSLAAMTVPLVYWFNNKVLAAITAFVAWMVSLFFVPMWPNDLYFQFFPLRLVFPALACVLAVLVARTRTQSGWRLGGCYLLLAFGLFWNLESGIMAVAMFTGFNILRVPRSGNFEWSWLGRSAAAQIAISVAAAVAAFLFVNLYFLVRFDEFPDWREMVFHLRLFSSGFYALPMAFDGAWWLHVLIYAAGTFSGLRLLFGAHGQGERERGAALLMLVGFGIMLFRYYVGRSHPVVLAWVSFPALFVFGFLLDGARRSSDRFARLLARSGTLVSLSIAAVCVLGVIAYAANGGIAGRGLDDKAATGRMDRILSNIEQLRKAHTSSDRDRVVVLAPFAERYFVRYGQPNRLHIDSMCQAFFLRDFDRMLAAVTDEDTRILVVDRGPQKWCGLHLPPQLYEDEWLAALGFTAVAAVDGLNFFMRSSLGQARQPAPFRWHGAP